MATRTKVESFSKASWTEAEVDAIAAGHLAHGAVSCVKSATETDWILTSEWTIF